MFIWLTFHVISIIKRSQDRNLESGTKAETIEKHCYWLEPRGLLSILSYKTQGHLPRDGTTHSGLDPPTSIINQKRKKNASQTCLQVSLMEACSQLRLFFR